MDHATDTFAFMLQQANVLTDHRLEQECRRCPPKTLDAVLLALTRSEPADPQALAKLGALLDVMKKSYANQDGRNPRLISIDDQAIAVAVDLFLADPIYQSSQ